MKKSVQKQLIQLEVSKLIPYERNPRKIPQQAVDDVKESYRQCGVIDPIEVDENNVILSGHTRRLAALELNIKTVDVLRVTGLTEQQKRKYRLLANKTGEKSSWDYELLGWELEDLDFEGYDFGFEGYDDQQGDGDAAPPSFKYEEQYAVTVMCDGEEQQREIYERLTEEGYTCKVVCV